MNKRLTWLLPVKSELVLYGIISILTLSASLLYGYFKKLDPIATYGANRSIAESFNSWLISLDQMPITKDVVQYLFWYVAGIVIFSFALYLKRAFDEVGENFSVAFRYHHPNDFNQQSFWWSVVRHALFHLVIVTVIIGVILLLASFAVPLTKITITETIYAVGVQRLITAVVAFLFFAFLSLVWLSISFRAIFLGRLP